ncbi:MAG: 50S ribosomal protein L17 [Planctomycetota bacterium]|nr:MAG: 50S ribosomal protein L17 [Planctomycetota bacterium]
MRHRKRGRKLGRNAAHRRALARNLAIGFIKQFGVSNREYVVTTRAKAKEYRPFIERLITLGRRALAEDITPHRKLALRRRALMLLPNKAAVKKLFEEIAPRYADRPGGYTRIIKTGSHRLGDGAQKVLLAYVPAERRRPGAAAVAPTVKTGE